MKQNFNNNFRDESVIAFSHIVDQLFNKSIDSFSKEFGITPSDVSYPKVDVIDYPDRIDLIAEIPGMEKEDIDISVDNDLLILSGSRKNLREKDAKYILKELKSSSFKRTFRFGTKMYDATKISAKFTNGILILSLPKTNITSSTIKVNIQ